MVLTQRGQALSWNQVFGALVGGTLEEN